MSGRRSSTKINLAIAISILAHILLALFFWRLSWRWDHLAATLSDAGGVIWFNLNPGGSGSGGEGGSGAPKEEPLGGSEAKSTKVESEKKKTPRETATPPKKKVEPGIPALPEEKPAVEPPNKAEEEKSAGIRGPGEGDGQGAKSGSGGGSGEGSGQGQGAGGGSGQGPGGNAPLGSGGSGQGGNANEILAKIRNKIARAKRYPRQARSEGLEGVCGLSFAIKPDGSLDFVELSKSSGYSVLDEEALATVRRAAPFPYYDGPIRFSLRFSLKDL